MTRLLVLLATLVAALGLAAGVPATARADNGAVAVNTKDGSSVFKFAFKIKHVLGDVVDETNAAVAYASCTDCSTTAIAIEIVLVEGSPSTFTPTNEAIAINYLCNLCNTFAAAYQFTIQSAGPVHFDAQGRQELAAIRKEIRELEKQNLTPFELAEQLKPLIDRLKAVLQNDLVAGPPQEDENDGEDTSNAGETVPPGGTRTVETQPEATVTGPVDTGTTETVETTETTTEPTTTEDTTTGVTTTTTTP
jgi:putative peptide zinc metalloprotease protein